MGPQTPRQGSCFFCSPLLAVAPRVPPTSSPWDASNPDHTLRAHSLLLTLLSPLLHSSIPTLSLPQYSTQVKSIPKAFKSPPGLPPADISDNNSLLSSCFQPLHAAPLRSPANWLPAETSPTQKQNIHKALLLVVFAEIPNKQLAINENCIKPQKKQ